MHVVVVYESLYGNTHEVASAVCEGIRRAEPGSVVTCLAVAEATPDAVGEPDLLVVGGPTHMRGMTSALSRKMGVQAETQKAVKATEPAKGGDARASAPPQPIEPGALGPGVRDWLHGLPRRRGATRAAVFDTRLGARLAGGAGHGIARRLRHRGYPVLGEPEGFVVDDASGRLREGELDRARAWGAGLVRVPVA